MERLINYIKDTWAELRHVSWPTGKQSIIYTVLVIAISILVALFIKLFDYILTSGLNWFIK